MNEVSLWVSFAALAMSVLSLYFARESWRESHRPIVSAHVRTHTSGNYNTALELVVENSGSQPARNIRFTVDARSLAKAFAPTVSESDSEDIRACFSTKFIIPVLANGASISNAFGLLSQGAQNSWNWHSRLPIAIAYEGLDDRKFEASLDLFIADNEGFASSAWRKKQ